MPQSLTLTTNGTDTSSTGSVRNRSGNENEGKQKSSSISVAAPSVNVRPSSFYYMQVGPDGHTQIIDAQSGKTIGVLKGQTRHTSNAPTRLTISDADLWAGIDSLLDANFLDVVSVASGNERQVLTSSQRQIADKFVASMSRLITRRGMTWYPPGVSVDEDDNTIEISWWRRNKALIFTVETDNAITYLKVSGPHIYNDMEEGTSPTIEQVIELWQWLYG